MVRNNTKRKAEKGHAHTDPDVDRTKPVRRRRDYDYETLEKEMRAAWGRDIHDRTSRTELRQAPIELLRNAKRVHLFRLQVRNPDFIVPGAPITARAHLQKHMPGRYDSAWNRFIWGTPVPNQKIMDKVNAARKLERAAAAEKEKAQEQAEAAGIPFSGKEFLLAIHPEAYGNNDKESPVHDTTEVEDDEEVLEELNIVSKGTGPYSVDEDEEMKDTLAMEKENIDVEEKDDDQKSSSSEGSSSEDEGYADIGRIDK